MLAKIVEISLGAILINNFIFSQFLGCCPFLGCSNKVDTAFGMGVGFTLALTLAGLLREVLGNGTAFGASIFPESFEPIGIFIQPPGAFLVIAFIIAVMNAIGIKTRQRKLVEQGCDGRCGACASPCAKAEGGNDK